MPEGLTCFRKKEAIHNRTSFILKKWGKKGWNKEEIKSEKRKTERKKDRNFERKKGRETMKERKTGIRSQRMKDR
jgi:hypothetical protein